jgi:RNA-directed DNA polymerase
VDVTLEPKGKLDTAVVVVNGPEGSIPSFDEFDLDEAEDNVRRLRRRIFTASRSGDLRRVRNLQKLMLRSRSNTLVAVRRVTQVNAGRRTAGVDGRLAVNSVQRGQLVEGIHRQTTPWLAWPVRRVFIPKGNGKQRPLGIPVIVDRVLQARVVNALEPEWEARFEARSYGFRPGRGCHDAIAQLFQCLRGANPRRLWVLDADLEAAFDRIDHDHLTASVGGFPARALVRQWLKAGVVERGQLTPTDEGVPQGGVVSPLLLNIALHGMETAAGVRYHWPSQPEGSVRPGSTTVVRYADDLLALCHSRQQAEQVKTRLGPWLAERGLRFNEDKTRIAHVDDDGFCFLGFHIRRWHGKLLIRPSPEAVRRIKRRLRETVRQYRGAPTAALLRALNPVVRGWAAYYHTVVSNRVFHSLDDYLFHLLYRWALRRHPRKSRRWVVSRYWGRFNRARQDRWVFGDKQTGAYLHKLSWTPIVRHVMVKGTSSVDDPNLVDYWRKRRSRSKPPVSNATLRLLQAQQGRCDACGDYLLHADEQPQSPEQWERWLRAVTRAISSQHIAFATHALPYGPQIRLIHAHCQKRRQAPHTNDRTPSRLA